MGKDNYPQGNKFSVIAERAREGWTPEAHSLYDAASEVFTREVEGILLRKERDGANKQEDR